jgi:anti-sigma B factor antagonist
VAETIDRTDDRVAEQTRMDHAGSDMTDPQEPMTVTTSRTGTTTVVALAGELDLHSSELLSAAVEDALGDPSPVVEIDAGDLTFADSAGLRALLSAREAAEQQGVALRLGRISPALGRLLDMTGLREVFEVPTA